MPRQRWSRRIIGVFVALVIVAVAVFFYRLVTRDVGEKRLQAMVAHLDATDPTWRLDQPPIDDPALPIDQNSAELVPKFKSALAGVRFEVARPDGTLVSFPDPPNRVLDDDDMTIINRALAADEAALDVARSFKNLPEGRRRSRIPADSFGTRVHNANDTQMVFTILDVEAERLVQDGRPGAALQLVRAQLNAARSINGDILLYDSLTRVAGGKMAVRRTERIVGLKVPAGGLAETQEALLREAESDALWSGIRGERAFVHRMFENIRGGRGTFSSELLYHGGPRPSRNPISLAEEWRLMPHVPGEHAACLELLSRAAEIRNLPDHEQSNAVRDLVESYPDSSGTLAANNLAKNVRQYHRAGLRVKAQLRSAATGLAVEQFRKAHGRWPASLDEIPKDLLPSIPLDPIDGKPLKYVHRDDGVTIYSIGEDEQDDRGTIKDGIGASIPGQDFGFRLYNPDQRGLPALPRPPVPGIDSAEPPKITVADKDVRLPIPREVGRSE